MKPDSLGPAGDPPRDCFEPRRWAWPTPLEFSVGAMLIAILALTLTWTVRRDDAFRSAEDAKIAYAEAPPPAGPTVSLTIDFGNGVERRFSGIAWKEAMTAADVMQAARRMSPGLNYEVRGTGEMSLLNSLDGVLNGAGDGRYWFYEVNGQRGEVSFAAHPIAAGDRVLWTFKKPE